MKILPSQLQDTPAGEEGRVASVKAKRESN
jgi:hypothetical protein